MGLKINHQQIPPCHIGENNQRFKWLKSLIYQASEQRQLEKSSRLDINWGQGLEGAKEQLYQLLMRGAGYSNYEEPFLRLAQRHPFSCLFGSTAPATGKIAVLAIWLGELGLLEQEAKEPTLASLQQAYRQSFNGKIVEPLSQHGRPNNHPARRLTGMYHHFNQLSQQGLIKGWLRFFYQVERIIQRPKHHRSELLKLLDQQFPTPNSEPLAQFSSFTSLKKSKRLTRLIGAERQRVLLVNTVMPFFLAWATFSQDRLLERTLFHLYLLLPTEGKNHKTAAMEARLGVQEKPFKPPQNLACHQGLIQFYDQLCQTYFDHGCQGCPLPGWLSRG